MGDVKAGSDDKIISLQWEIQHLERGLGRNF